MNARIPNKALARLAERLWSYAAVALACLVCATEVHALPIEFEFGGKGAAGEIDGTPFNNKNFTVTLVADTDDVKGVGGDLPNYAFLFGSIKIPGVGSGTFDTLLGTFVAHDTGVVGFKLQNGCPGGPEWEPFINTPLCTPNPGWDLFDLSAPGMGLEQYDMTADFHQISTTNVFALNQFIDVGTSLGMLTVSSVREGTFMARLVRPIPEPGSVFLIGVALLLITAFSGKPQKGSA
jgi:hypothetical protein